jgi:hypothetical protein
MIVLAAGIARQPFIPKLSDCESRASITCDSDSKRSRFDRHAFYERSLASIHIPSSVDMIYGGLWMRNARVRPSDPGLKLPDSLGFIDWSAVILLILFRLLSATWIAQTSFTGFPESKFTFFNSNQKMPHDHSGNSVLMKPEGLRTGLCFIAWSARFCFAHMAINAKQNSFSTAI